MGFIGGFLSSIGREAGNLAAETAKQKLADAKASYEDKKQRMAEAKHLNAAFRLPKGFCEGANGKVWRATKLDGDNLYLTIRVSGGKIYQKWFNISQIVDFYEDV